MTIKSLPDDIRNIAAKAWGSGSNIRVTQDEMARLERWERDNKAKVMGASGYAKVPDPEPSFFERLFGF